MPSTSYPATAVLAALFVGLVVGAGVVAFATPTDLTVSPTSSTAAATGCLGPDESAPTSWVARAPAGDRTTFIFNRTFTHDAPSVRIEGTVEEQADGVYVYRLTTSPDEDSEKPPSEDCTPRTKLDAVVSVPSEYESFTVTVDGEELVTIENDGSNSLFRTLEG
ncbi:hypothetical protein C455_13745 [Haloferax larsenii JCM 13917]|nr:hypothetical protein [Haloferax larsenii]ELZ77404.1 hypothetical protein C455_13745 [Haloferax larsenii JCM 13917]